MFTESVRMGCSFPACRSGSAKISKMFDISPTLHDSASGLLLRPPGNHPVVGLYGLSVTIPILSYTANVLF